MKQIIEDICKTNILGNPKFSWFSKDLCFVEYKKFRIAFDITLGVSNVGVDIVLRPNSDRKQLVELYSLLENRHKYRLFTIEKNRIHEVLADLINREYLRVSESIGYEDKYSISSNHEFYYLDSINKLTHKSPLKMYFWTGVPNFGDLIGPWLASKLSDRPILNVRDIGYSEDAIFGVGSIIGMINEQHQNCKIWGSGLISDQNFELIAKKLKSSNVKKISAVRGKITEKLLTSASFNVDKVFGDPALVFSELYDPEKVRLNFKRVIVPHYIHFDLFREKKLEGFHLVDVKSELTDVIAQIANADLVISTSLHGLIIAQSYGVPWIHLHLLENPKLSGDDFKFSDFFTTLVQEDVSQEKIFLKDLNQLTLERISSRAKLPKYSTSYNSAALIDAFYECL